MRYELKDKERQAALEKALPCFKEKLQRVVNGAPGHNPGCRTEEVAPKAAAERSGRRFCLMDDRRFAADDLRLRTDWRRTRGETCHGRAGE